MPHVSHRLSPKSKFMILNLNKIFFSILNQYKMNRYLILKTDKAKFITVTGSTSSKKRLNAI